MKIKPLFFATALLWGGVGVAQAQTNLHSENPFSEGVLINGVRWATSNVDMPGTFAANPEDAGLFYQWGSNVGWSSTDPCVSEQ